MKIEFERLKWIRKMSSYSLKELFELWIEYLNYYDVTFQELSRTSGLKYSFPKWLEENDRKNVGYSIRNKKYIW